jgi:hypothetical protein
MQDSIDAENSCTVRFSVPANFYFRLKPELITSIGFAQSGFENMFIFA